MNDVGEMALLPQIIPHLAECAPHCDIRCASLDVQQLAGALESGVIDLAIGWFPDLDKTGFFAQKLFSRSFVCLARANHPAMRDKRITMKTFLELSHIVVESQGRSSELFEALLKKQGLSRRVQLSLPHFMSVPAIIAQTDLIVTVPTPVAQYFHRFDNLRVFQPPVNIRSYAIKQYWHERYQADPAVRWIRQQTAALFAGAAM
jgi:DNA-binding transcriptional LysR family regulator